MAMHFKIPREFGARLLNVGMSGLRFGIERDFIDAAVAVDYAVRMVEAGASDSSMLELATCNPDDKLAIAGCLARFDDAVDENEVGRWAFISLCYLYEIRERVDDPLGAVAEIYAGFGYLPEISHLVRYMPADGASRDLMSDWKGFLTAKVYGKIVK